MATGGKEEDLLLEEMYLPQDTEALQDASIVGRRDTTHTTAPKRNSYPATKETTTDKLTSLTCKMRKNRTTVMITKCMTSKKLTQ